jgi:hypothetical protein
MPGGLVARACTGGPGPAPDLVCRPLPQELHPYLVQDKVDDRRVKARPTLHYRLPNCEIDKPGWGLATIWADWLVLERLATDAVQLGAICRHYATFLDRPLARLSGNWLQECEKWLRTEGLL